MRYSRIGWWAVAVAVAVGVTTTVVATATGAAGRDVLTEDGVADALAAVQPAPAAPAPVGRTDASVGSETYRAGDEKLLQTTGGDIVVTCDAGVLGIRSVAPKPGYRLLMMELDRKALGPANAGWLRWPTKERGVRIAITSKGRLAFVFDKASSEVSVKVTVTCVDGEPVAKESEIVKNYGAGKG
jgi:hypothetical protein